ncbi:hypothetical protein RIF29_08889 [Crotalaria pallida]|uniref:Transposase n=1 Tax=Crotalaria pallida TaxID=3830 RepID=A0AAN9ILK8_CROPI
MDDSLSNPTPSQNEPASSNSSKRVRGPTRLHRVAKRRAAGRRISIPFKPISGRACGPDRAEFNTFLAMEGRTKASIIIDDWRLVPKNVKELIWQSVKVTYDVPDNEIIKWKSLQVAKDGWKAFKTRLANAYIYGEKKHLSPLDEFDFLTSSDWEKFYEIRTSSDFEEKRKKGKEELPPSLKNAPPPQRPEPEADMLTKSDHHVLLQIRHIEGIASTLRFVVLKVKF